MIESKKRQVPAFLKFMRFDRMQISENPTTF